MSLPIILKKTWLTLPILNLQLQDPNTTIIIHKDCIKTFMYTIKLWIRKIDGNISCFPRLAQIIDDSNISENLNNEIVAHLKSLYSEF